VVQRRWVYFASFEDVAQAARASGAVETAFSIAEFPAIVKSRSDPDFTPADESAVCAIICTSGITGGSQRGYADPEKHLEERRKYEGMKVRQYRVRKKQQAAVSAA